MYIEASSPRKQGDNAKLVLSLPGNGELGCLSFYYHMYGDNMGTLNVFSGNMMVFTESGDHGNIWIRAERTIVLENNVSLAWMPVVAVSHVIPDYLARSNWLESKSKPTQGHYNCWQQRNIRQNGGKYQLSSPTMSCVEKSPFNVGQQRLDYRTETSRNDHDCS